MPQKLKVFVQRWVISTVSVLVATQILRTRIDYHSWKDLLIATLVLGLLNSFVRPILMLLSLPLLILSLGLFTIVINAALLLIVSSMLQPGFVVRDFSSAFWGALIISIVSLLLNSLTGTGETRVAVRRGKPPEKPKDDKDVIDV